MVQKKESRPLDIQCYLYYDANRTHSDVATSFISWYIEASDS